MKVINWKFKENINISIDEFWYDITDGGYIKPEEVLTDADQIIELNNAIKVIKSFEDSLCELMDEKETHESDI